eukprot:TRINITY_DN328_c0_g1_i1.p1 TRINITY_DN328_c0_g1~~TRINITY_DN328_c0_g1_i1.p1  ORF type:complete len:121 (-),score=57.78 TRINITY_DN328_c0_g1_i1:105-467(-)
MSSSLSTAAASLRLSKQGPKRLQELEQSVPEAKVLFQSMPAKRVRAAVEAGRLVYLSKLKGEVTTWQQAAELIKKSFEADFGTTWHVVAGTNFGAFCTFEQDNVVQFSVGQMIVLLFKHG